MLLNMAQVFHLLYQLRPVKFDPELEEVYHTLFEPFKVGIEFRFTEVLVKDLNFEIDTVSIEILYLFSRKVIHNPLGILYQIYL